MGILQGSFVDICFSVDSSTSKSKLQSIFLPNICFSKKIPSFRTHLFFSGWGLGLRGGFLRTKAAVEELQYCAPSITACGSRSCILDADQFLGSHGPPEVGGRAEDEQNFSRVNFTKIFFFNKRRKEDFLRFLEM